MTMFEASGEAVVSAPTGRRGLRRQLRPRRMSGVAMAAVALVAGGGSLVACQPGPPTCQGQPASIVGTPGNDTLTGTAINDIIVGLGGNDTISGLDGSDFLCGGAGIDTIEGGNHGDYIADGPGTDVIRGGAGADRVSYEEATAGVVVDLARAEGGPELDRLIEIENVAGTRYNDLLIGDAGQNNLTGLDGSDTLIGGADKDYLSDGSRSPAGTNHYVGGEGNDIITGGPANDIASYSSMAPGGYVLVNLATGRASGEGEDTLTDIDGMIGGPGNDWLFGDANRNTFDGRGGDDSITGRGGDDAIHGGEGFDRATWFESYVSITADLTAGRAVGEGTDRLTAVESLQGGKGPDTLTGDAGTNVIDGGPATDTCNGGGGDDYYFDCP